MPNIKVTNFKDLENKKFDNKTLDEVKIFLQKHQYSQAEKKSIQLIKKYPQSLNYQNLLAIVYVSQKKFKNAITVLKKLIKQNPNLKEPYLNLANIYFSLNDLINSELFFQKVIIIDSNHSLALNGLGNIYKKQNKWHDAEQIYSQLINIHPKNIEYLNSYGLIKIKLKNYIEAKKLFNQTLSLNPKYIPALINLGVVYKNVESFNNAIKYFKLALKFEPHLSLAQYNLATVYEEQKKYKDAIIFFEKAINSNANYAEAHYSLGCSLNKIGQSEKAILSFKKAIRCNPGHIHAQYNMARNLLAIDDFKNGWKGYEYRQGKDIFLYYEKLGIAKQKIWDGKKFEGRLFVHAEQGIGDEILYSSIFSDLSNYHKNLYVLADTRLIEIYRRSFPNIKFLDRKQKLQYSNSAKHILLGSLGQYFRRTKKDFKSNQQPWLTPYQKECDKINNLIPLSKKIKVGISWQTFADKYDDRSIDLKKLLSIFPNKYFYIISLQKESLLSENTSLSLGNQVNTKIHFLDNFDYKNNIEGLSALINHCDCVVSIDNTTVHLAGALGQDVYTLVPARTNWYWHTGRKISSSFEKCLWYPNTLLFKQTKWRSWTKTLTDVKKELKLKYKF